MSSRIAGILALIGGLAWLVKFGLIWANGGTNTTGGLVGILFDIGAVGILLGAGVRVWYASDGALLRYRLLALGGVMVAFVAAVNLPIALGWALFGRTWLAEEVGVLLTAVAALVLGLWWMSATTRTTADVTASGAAAQSPRTRATDSPAPPPRRTPPA